MTLTPEDVENIAEAVARKLREEPPKPATAPAPTDDNELLTIQQVCAWLKISRTTLTAKLPEWKRHGVRVRMAGRRMRFLKKELERCAL